MINFTDIMIAKKLSTQGQIETLAAQAREAVVDAAAAVANIDSITEQTTANNEIAVSSASTAQTALETANAAETKANQIYNSLDSLVNISDVQAEIKKLTAQVFSYSESNYNGYGITTNYPDNTSTTSITPPIKFYTEIGTNTDGSMTQKAIKDYVASVKQDLEKQIDDLSVSGLDINLGAQNSGKMVAIDSSGHVVPTIVTEEDVITTLMKISDYAVANTLGLEIDYENKSYQRTQDSENYSAGNDFSSYSMYKRIRCNVSDDGNITAFYGDNDYKEDGSNGQVMVYQPKFYYKRIPVTMTSGKVGKIIKKEKILISETPQLGFKLHPLFINEAGQEVSYVLLSAFEGSVYDTSTSTYDTSDSITIDFDEDKLCSVGNVKPVSGARNALNLINAEKIAKNRGEGWHIYNMRAQSAEQILETIEFGTMNSQIGSGFLGISTIESNSSYNCASLTGSTPSSGSGQAESTVNEINGNLTTYTSSGRCSYSYRGVENPWGNIWKILGDILIYGNGAYDGGIPYICNNYNYTDSITNNYTSIGFCLPNGQSYISAMGYGNEDLDWVFMPAEASNANSILPVGDIIWPMSNLNSTNMTGAGGSCSLGDSNGIYCYGSDRASSYYARTYGVRLILVPIKNNIHDYNVVKWTVKSGG